MLTMVLFDELMVINFFIILFCMYGQNRVRILLSNVTVRDRPLRRPLRLKEVLKMTHFPVRKKKCSLLPALILRKRVL